MIGSLFRLLGKLTLLLASAAFLTSVSLFILGSFLLTFPVLRKTPRQQRLQATTDMASAAFRLIAANADKPRR